MSASHGQLSHRTRLRRHAAGGQAGWASVALLLLVPLLSLPSLADAAAPSRAALRRAYEGNRGLLVEVQGPHRRGPGVLVGASGHVLTSVRYVGLERASVRIAGRDLDARVLMANAGLGVALLELPAGSYPTAYVGAEDHLSAGSWLVAIRSGGSEPRPALAQVRRHGGYFFELDRPLPAGVPLFSSDGDLAGVVVRSTGGGARALSIHELRRRMGGG